MYVLSVGDFTALWTYSVDQLCNMFRLTLQAMNELNGKEINNVAIEISLAKPPSDKKKKEEMLRAREKRMMAMLHARGQ